jgi:hypothetical protein
MCLKAEEFIRRFLLHVLPHRFIRIRHYGLLAGRNVPTKLARCRELLGQVPGAVPEVQDKPLSWFERVLRWTGEDPRICPRCQGPLTRRAWEDAPPPVIARCRATALLSVDST